MNRTIRTCVAAMCLATTCFILFALTNYGGIRSPDEEVVFQVAGSLVAGDGFQLTGDLEGAEGFGAAVGKDGKRYAIYPPGNSVWLAPIVGVSQAINRTGWYRGEKVPYSFYVDNGFQRFVAGKPPGKPAVHALRFTVTFFNLITSVLGVLVFWHLVRRLTASEIAAFATALLFAVGTLTWSYSATLFSEPLVTLFALLSLGLLLRFDRKCPSDTPDGPNAARLRPLALIASGVCLGIATAAHVTAVLYVPFFGGYVAWCFARDGGARAAVRPAILWAAGFVAIAALLGWYNHARFGSPLASGRTDSDFNPIVFHAPWTTDYWRGFYGLTVSPGKGLLFFCPAVVLAGFAWPRFIGRHRALAITMLGAAIARVAFIASYFDWHGGFCLGPRYLLPMIPLVLLPIAPWLDRLLASRKLAALSAAAVALWLCASQQFYFALCDVFTFYHMLQRHLMSQVQNPEMAASVFGNDAMYLSWQYSPLHEIHKTSRAAYLLRDAPGTNLQVWLIGTVVLAALIALTVWWVRRALRATETT